MTNNEKFHIADHTRKILYSLKTKFYSVGHRSFIVFQGTLSSSFQQEPDCDLETPLFHHLNSSFPRLLEVVKSCCQDGKYFNGSNVTPLNFFTDDSFEKKNDKARIEREGDAKKRYPGTFFGYISRFLGAMNMKFHLL